MTSFLAVKDPRILVARNCRTLESNALKDLRLLFAQAHPYLIRTLQSSVLHGPNDNDTSFPSDFVGEMLRRWHYVFVFPDESDDANNADYWNSLMPDASEAWDRTHRSWLTRYQGYQPQALSSLANFIYFYHNNVFFSEETCLVLVLLLSLVHTTGTGLCDLCLK